MTSYQIGLLSFSAVAVGIWALVKGGDMTVDGAVSIANRFNLSKVFIAATIIAFGTSVPELFTSMNANLQGYPGISIGNVIGSNIANILLVFAVACLFVPMTCSYYEVEKELYLMVLATALLCVGVMFGVIGSVYGAVMFSILIIFVTYQYFFGTTGENTEGVEGDSTVKSLVIGLVLLAIGSELVVTGSVVVGELLGVPEAVIGLTVIAIGTSLPELAASVTAARKGEISMIYGNLIGSNIFNVLSIVGLTAIAKPILIDDVVNIATLIMCAMTMVFFYALYRNYAFTKTAGVFMLAIYIIYLITQYQ